MFAEAMLIGVALGLIIGLLGGGGGIITVPALMALFSLSFDLASTASLMVMILGCSVALIAHHRAQRVDWRTGMIFGSVGVVGSVIGARWALILDDRVQQLAFSVLLVAAGLSMLRNARRSKAGVSSEEGRGTRLRAAKLIPLSTGVGLTVGLFGVGGGFITVPALVGAARMPIKRATATALVVIIINAIAGLIARFNALPGTDVMVPLMIGAAIGAGGGALWSRKLPSWILSATFGALALVIAVYNTLAA